MASSSNNPSTDQPALKVGPDWPFYAGLGIIGGTYVLLLVAMIVAEATHTTTDDIWEALQKPEIQYSIKLSLYSCAMSTILSVWVAVPIGYLMSRHEFPGKALVDSILDIPIVLPPLVVGLCLLILFNTPVFNDVESVLHGFERWMSDNLVPLLVFGGLLALGIPVFVLLRPVIASRLARLSLVGLLAVVVTGVVSRSYLFPVLPEWVPVPDDFKTVDVDYRDQSPLQTSLHVYRARFSYHGTGNDLVKKVEKTLEDSEFSKTNIMRSATALKSIGQRYYLAMVPEDKQAGAPFDGEIVVAIRTQKPVQQLRDDGVTRFDTTPLDWVITYDVRRLPLESRENIRPKITFPVTYEIPAIILAQFMVACAFAVRTMRVTFDQLSPRFEHVALTLGCNHGQAFWRVVLPQCHRGILAAGTLAWARSLGEFGPILIFAGSTRMKTEVLSTTVFLELGVGSIEGAVAASLIMILAAIIVLVIARVFGLKRNAF